MERFIKSYWLFLNNPQEFTLYYLSNHDNIQEFLLPFSIVLIIIFILAESSRKIFIIYQNQDTFPTVWNNQLVTNILFSLYLYGLTFTAIIVSRLIFLFLGHNLPILKTHIMFTLSLWGFGCLSYVILSLLSFFIYAFCLLIFFKNVALDVSEQIRIFSIILSILSLPSFFYIVNKFWIASITFYDVSFITMLLATIMSIVLTSLIMIIIYNLILILGARIIK